MKKSKKFHENVCFLFICLGLGFCTPVQKAPINSRTPSSTRAQIVGQGLQNPPATQGSSSSTSRSMGANRAIGSMGSSNTGSIGSNAGSIGSSSQSTLSSNTGSQGNTNGLRKSQVSAFEIDDSTFFIQRFTVGLETYLNSQTPVLNYDLPSNADYVEILRCPNNTILAGTSATMQIQDIEFSNLSQADRDNLFRNNDFFQIAINAKCAQLTLGTTGLTFYDAWLPSGSYRYLIHACVSPDRLIDVGNLTTRNCSRQVSVSASLLHYQNTRDQKQSQALQDASAASSQLLMSLNTAKSHADEYACYIQWCECGANPNQQSICQRDANGIPAPCTGGEYGRAVATAKKNALVTLIAISADLLLTAATTPMESFGSIGGAIMGFGAYSAALSGFSFSTMFLDLATQSQDFPKSCAKGISLDLQMNADAMKAQSLQSIYMSAQCKAAAAGASITAAAGAGANTSSGNCQTTPQAPPSAPPPSNTGTGVTQ